MNKKLAFAILCLLLSLSFVSQHAEAQITLIEPFFQTDTMLDDPLFIDLGQSIDTGGFPLAELMVAGNSVVNLTGGTIGTGVLANFSDDSIFNAQAGNSSASIFLGGSASANISGGNFIEGQFGLELGSSATANISGGVFSSPNLVASDEFAIQLGDGTSLDIQGTNFTFTPTTGGSGVVSLPGTGSAPISAAGLLTGTFVDGNDFRFRLSGTAFDSGGFGGLTLSDPNAVPEPSSALLIVVGAMGLATRRRRA